MKFKASILILFMVLVAGNAFATPATSLQETTEFTDWTSPYGFEASNMGLQFGGPFNWRMGATNDSVIGSMFNSENYSRSASPGAPVISFNRGATEFYFRYTSPVTVTITMEDSAAFDLPWALGYTQPYHDNFEYVGNTSNTITYNLLDTQVQGSPEPGFGFYMSDMFSNYYTNRVHRLQRALRRWIRAD